MTYSPDAAAALPSRDSPRAGAAERDFWIAGWALLLLVAWEASGWDLAASALWGGPAGFPWRDAWVTQRLLHDGGRIAAAVLLASLAFDAWRPLARGPSRRRRLFWLGATLAALMIVPAAKRLSSTSCPWSLSAFGGSVPYVPHWLLGVADGGPGHCFPSGHAVAAFAFFGGYFLWRSHAPRLARSWLALVLGLGGLFGWAQTARGAHFVSHTLWSAWACWVICAAAAWALARRDRATRLLLT
jgi:membrane-associated PAP2 superfamily phosphatase